MLTFEDCVALSGLTKAEIDAIAEHEHLPEILAAEFGHYLICQDDGALRVRAILADDLRHAEKRGDQAHAEELQHFIAQHMTQNKTKSC